MKTKKKKCNYCSGDDRDFLISADINAGVFGEFEFCGLISHGYRSVKPHIEFTISNKNIDNEIFLENMEIKYCPMCGKKMEAVNGKE